MPDQVDLVLPGLFNLPVVELDRKFIAQQLPSLNHLLRFSRRRPNSLFALDAILSASFGIETSQVLPYAAAYRAEKDSPQGGLMLCRATHLKPDLRNALLIPLDEDKQTLIDISILINDLNGIFKEDLAMTDLVDGLCLVELKQCQPPSHYPHYLSVVGRKVDPYIEQSRAALPWYRLINEIQMFLHTHEVNRKRLENGRLVINSLWCWGAGEFIQPKSTHSHWFCDETPLQVYAERAGIGHQPVAAFKRSGFEGDALIVDLSLLAALKSPTDIDLSRLLIKLEKSLFDPLLTLIKNGQVSLSLKAGYNIDLEISPTSRYKFWRRPVNLVDWLT